LSLRLSIGTSRRPECWRGSSGAERSGGRAARQRASLFKTSGAERGWAVQLALTARAANERAGLPKALLRGAVRLCGGLQRRRSRPPVGFMPPRIGKYAGVALPQTIKSRHVRAMRNNGQDTEVVIMKIWFAAAAVAAFGASSAPAYADMTVKSQDGTMELALPNGWHEAKPEGPLSKIVAADGRGSRVVVRVYPEEDFKDGKTVANFAVDKLKLLDNDGAKTEDVQVNGKPAVRLNLTGTQSSGMKAGYIITVFEAGGMYIDVMGKSDASAFAKQEQVLEGFASQLKITPAAASNGPAASSSPTASSGSTVKPPAPAAPK